MSWELLPLLPILSKGRATATWSCQQVLLVNCWSWVWDSRRLLLPSFACWNRHWPAQADLPPTSTAHILAALLQSTVWRWCSSNSTALCNKGCQWRSSVPDRRDCLCSGHPCLGHSAMLCAFTAAIAVCNCIDVQQSVLCPEHASCLGYGTTCCLPLQGVCAADCRHLQCLAA